MEFISAKLKVLKGLLSASSSPHRASSSLHQVELTAPTLTGSRRLSSLFSTATTASAFSPRKIKMSAYPFYPFPLSTICFNSPTSKYPIVPMAIHHNSPPAPFEPNRTPPTTVIPHTESSGIVKLLCRFGGKIMPRLGDGGLHYAGGQARIITFRRNTTLQELFCKMEDAYGGPVVLRYQLPDQDLDTLISVSSIEDLNNMMDECDRLSKASKYGSNKLRVFLFPPSDTNNSLAGFSDDSRQGYIDAINSVTAFEADACRMRWKDLVENAASTLNSVAGDDEFINNEVGTSTTILSPPTVASAYVLQQHQLPPQATTPLCFSTKQNFIGRKLGQASNSMEPENLRVHEQLMVGQENTTERLHNARNALLSSNDTSASDSFFNDQHLWCIPMYLPRPTIMASMNVLPDNSEMDELLEEIAVTVGSLNKD